MSDVIQQIPKLRPVTVLLDQVDNVSDLRALSTNKLPQLAHELRLYLLYCVGQTGGHLGAGLGVVELTIALHYLLNTPDDKLIWDVGHQAYPHKILTGRKEQMLSMRQLNGLSPFPKRTESHFDCFGVGHASTSISALQGMVLMAERLGANKRHHVAVIGDGALTGGMAYEALNHMAHTQVNALVVVNDNDMSISRNQGGLANFLDTADAIVGSKSWFTALGFTYTGPIDGHDLPNLLVHLQSLLALPGPKLLHLHTVKGKGYGPAETDPIAYHAIDKIAPLITVEKTVTVAKTITAEKTITHSPKPSMSFSALFGQWAYQVANTDKRLQVITPAMISGSGLTDFCKNYPQQCHDVAIAEQHAVTMAAGMACAGGKPVVAIYSTFLQRGYDQLVHDIALQNLDVLFAIDRAGIVGEDGATHTGAYDYSLLTCLPNMVVMAPSNVDEMQTMLTFGYQYQGPVSVRYPRGNAYQQALQQSTDISLGRANKVLNGHKIALLSFGAVLDSAWEVADKLGATLIDMRFIKPLDTSLLTELMDHEYWVTLEDHAVVGGAGTMVAQWLVRHRNDKEAYKTQSNKTQPKLLNLGLSDQVQTHGTRAQILASNGLDQQGICQAITEFIS